MYDIIIVGGGISGSYLASHLGKNFNTLLIERQKNIIPRDSGIVSSKILTFIGKTCFIKNQVCRMDINSPSGIKIRLSSNKPFAYLLERERFAGYLRRKAQKNSDIAYDNAKSVIANEDGVIVVTESGGYKGKIIIGADGVNSVVRNSINTPKPAFCYGMMCKTNKFFAGNGNINIFFNKYFSPDFFSWVIPQNHEYGLMTATRPKEYFDFFKKYYRLANGNCYGYPIPIGYTKSYGCRTLLVGDSCGQTKPITGGGIIFSLIAARHAMAVVKKAFEKNNFNRKALSEYEILWMNSYGDEIGKQALARLAYRKMTNKEIDRLFKSAAPAFEKIDSFDYDNLSMLWVKMPKMSVAKFAVEMIKCIF